MTPLVIAQLALQYGLPFVQQLIQWHASGKADVTPEDFAGLMKLAQYRSADALAEAGIEIKDGKVVPVGG